jgi:multidrug efflux pump
MILSDVSVTRPVFASVIGLLLIAFGFISWSRLPLREYPDIDPPVVTVETRYPGASAGVVENRITRIVEEQIAGVEGIKFVQSSSEDGRSRVTIEFNPGRDVDGAANDIRDRVSRVSRNLPEEADPPQIVKVDANDDVIAWFNLIGEGMTIPDLTDYTERYLIDRFSVIDGVARVRVAGSQSYAMRIWLDRGAMAARGLTSEDVENALRAENVELPAGQIESQQRQFVARVRRAFSNPEEFASLVLGHGADGDMIRLGDVARVERGAIETRTFFRGNGVSMVAVGIVKQSTANTIEVARLAREELERINTALPEGMELRPSYDTSEFVKAAMTEVYKTLGIAVLLVSLVIFLFLGNLRATVVPAVTVPISIIASFSALYIFGFSINLLTLLALALAIGLVVDDAIVVLENIHRRMDELGESALVAAFRGTRQVAFAVLATTAVLVAVFVPIAFLEGDVGRLFSEFALTLAATVVFSSLVALTVSPMLASKLLKPPTSDGTITRNIDRGFQFLRHHYRHALSSIVRHGWAVIIVFLALLAGLGWMARSLPSEYAPREDRGSFFILVNGPEGASYAYMEEYMNEVERRLMPYVQRGELSRLLIRAPRAFNNPQVFNSGMVITVLADWNQRRSGWEIMEDMRADLADLSGVRAFPVMRQGFGSAVQNPVQFTIGGGTYEQLVEWRDILLDKLRADNPGLTNLDWDYKETQPQIQVTIDYDRAAELGVTINSIGKTLETMLGSRRVTTYIHEGEEYDVIVEGERDTQRTPASLENIQVRSQRSGQLIPLSNVVKLEERADSATLNRYNRVRAITLQAGLAEGFSLGAALEHLERLARESLPETVIIDYKGQSLDYKKSGESLLFVFILGIVIVFLVLAAQFESYIHPIVIMLGVPVAIGGGLAGLWFTGGSLNLYTQIGLIMLVGLAAKNGILIVEFANQLRDEGMEFREAVLEASATRLRPIIMTGITTAAGSVPLVLSFGAGAETRFAIGVVVLFGVTLSTITTLVIIPVFYDMLARKTGSPGAVKRRLALEGAAETEKTATAA